VFTTVYDSGSCTITANNHGDSKSWSGSGTTAASIALGLQNNISNDNSAFVNATVSNNVVSLTAKTTGAATNYPLTSSCSYDSSNFSSPSFTTSNSGSTLTGGKDAGYQTVYDTGSVTVTINSSPSFSKTISYGQADTPTSLATALATALSHNTDPTSPVSTSSSGGTLSFTAVNGGTSTDYAFTTSSATNNANFTGTSFPITPASGTMTGGTNTTTLYSFSLTPAGDRQITSANDFVNGNWVFGYDQFNRLLSSNKNSGQQTFSYDYDPYGNRWHQNAPQGGPAPQYIFNNNNHLNGSGVTYDALGEVLTDGLGNTFTWDAEGRLNQVKQGTTVIATYSYDAEGRRVHGPNGEYVYDLGGKMITQVGLNGAWNFGEIYAGTRHLATYSNGTTNFYHGDWLGTKRVMTGLNGNASVTCTGFAFGDGVSCTGATLTFNGFTDDIHGPETNLEHTLFRQYSGTEGRWLTPDPSGLVAVNPANPQTWNRYAYVTNNSINATDLTGLLGDGGWGPDPPDPFGDVFGFLNGLEQQVSDIVDYEIWLNGVPLFNGTLPSGNLQGPSFGFGGLTLQDTLQNILREAIPIDTCPAGTFECPADGSPLFGQPKLGDTCAGTDACGFTSKTPSWGDIWKAVEKADKAKDFWDKLVCTYKIWHCLNTSFGREEKQLEEQAKCRADGGDDWTCGIICRDPQTGDAAGDQELCRLRERASQSCADVIKECIPALPGNPFPWPF